MKPVLALVLGILAITVSGCALTHHRPKIEFPEEGRVILHFDDNPLVAKGLPYIEASINGITGKFVMDTGANAPYLTIAAVRRCGLALSEGKGRRVDMYYAKSVPMKLADDVTLVIAPRLKIHWSKAVVDPVNDSWFGLIDYHTLKAMHAIINMDEKTITISR